MTDDPAMPPHDLRVPKGYVAVVCWNLLAAAFGLAAYALMVLIVIASGGPLSARETFASFIFMMIFASFAAIMYVLPLVLLLTTVRHLIVRRVPRIDQSWRGAWLGAGAIALFIAALHVIGYGLVLEEGVRLLPLTAMIFASTLAGLMMPRWLFPWLRPGVFA